MTQQRRTVLSTHAPTWEARPWTSRAVHRLGEFSSSSAAGFVAASLVLAWAIVGTVYGFPSWWAVALYSVTGSVTFVMVFVIQHTQERQISGTQRKLDELIRSSTRADNSLIAVEETTDENLQALAVKNHAERGRATGDE